MAVDGLLDLEQTLLSACVPTPNADGRVTDEAERESVRNIDVLTAKVKIEQWSTQAASMFKALFEYRVTADGSLPEDVLLDMLTRAQVPSETRVKYHQLFQTLKSNHVSPAKFKYGLSKFLEDWEERQFEQILNDAYTVKSQGMQVGKDSLKGYRQSREYLHKRLYELDASQNSDIVEGDLRLDSDVVQAEYESRESQPASFMGVMTGFSPLDLATNGAKPGELWFVGAFTGQGKSFWLTNAAYHTCTTQSSNVVVFTSEMTYPQWRQRLIIRHSRQPTMGLPHGVSSRAYERGQLGADKEPFFRTLLDWKVNPKYGRFYLIQVPTTIGIQGIAAKLNMINSILPVHAVYLDYLRIMVPEGKGGRKTDDNLNQAIREAKGLAVTFNKGKGIPIFTGWQSNRSSFEKALESKEYTLTSWAEAGEVEKSADVITWMLQPPELADKHEILAGSCKYRSTATNARWVYFSDFDSSYLGIANQPQGVAGGSGPTPVFTPAGNQVAPISGLI